MSSRRYQYIGKLETLTEDAEFILRQVGAPPSLHFPPVTPSTTAALADAYFDALTPAMQQDLLSVYEDDFRIFGYSYRDFV